MHSYFLALIFFYITTWENYWNSSPFNKNTRFVKTWEEVADLLGFNIFFNLLLFILEVYFMITIKTTNQNVVKNNQEAILFANSLYHVKVDFL